MANTTFDLAKCKEIVDTIYELTRENGYTGPMGGNYYESAIRRILMKRGIVEKSGSTHNPKYKWVASMAPTDNLYKSVYNEHREIVANYPSQKKKEKPAEELPPPYP